MLVGDFIVCKPIAGTEWTGWVLDIDKKLLYGHTMATVWRPDCVDVIIKVPLDGNFDIQPVRL